MNQEHPRICVRIAVVIDLHGFWSATGNCAYESTEETVQAALDYLPQECSSPRHVVWVRAEVPLPLPQVLNGTVGTLADA